MNFLLLMIEDCAGSGMRLKRAINAHPDHSARAICTRPNSFLFDADMVNPDQSVHDKFHAWADAFVIYDAWPRKIVLRSGKPAACVYNGTAYRSRWDRFNREDIEGGIAGFGTTLDLCHHGPRWLPVPMPKLEQSPKTKGVFHVAHSPSNRARKGTAAIASALDGLPGVRLEITEGVSNAECLRRKAKAHLYIDQFRVGYGANAIEAWRLGMPVMSDLAPLPPGERAKSPPSRQEIRAQFDKEAKGLPFYRVTPETLRSSVEAFVRDRDLYDHWLERGVSFVEKYHSPAAVVERLLEGMGL